MGRRSQVVDAVGIRAEEGAAKVSADSGPGVEWSAPNVNCPKVLGVRYRTLTIRSAIHSAARVSQTLPKKRRSVDRSVQNR